MKLPTFTSISKPKSVTTEFNGISSKGGLYDTVNLILDGVPRTREPRNPVMLFSAPPDQILTCNDRLFFRFENTLKEILKDDSGMYYEGENQYNLNNIAGSPNRTLIYWDGGIYALPDSIKLGSEDSWQAFASGDSLSVALPFKNARTLFYSSGYSGGTVCEDSILLKTGVKLKFSWISDTVFTVVSTENAYTYLEDGSMMIEGTRVTLNRDVAGYKSLPASGNISYCVPEQKPILNPLIIGYNHNISFKGNTISFNQTDFTYYYDSLLSNFLRVGQRVKISGSSRGKNNIKAKITAIGNSYISFDTNFETSTESSKKVITVTPLIPEFSQLLLTEDRIFGVDNTENKLYISALKEPFMFYDDVKLPEDSWSVKLNEKATGITLWKDNIICFTESGGFRVLGYTALNFGLRQLSLNGIKKGCEGSLVRIGDTLYYCSARGVMKYSGGSDKKISSNVLEISDIKTAVTDGIYAYMLGKDRIWVYNTDTDTWWSESASGVRDVFYYKSDRYICTENALYLTYSGRSVFHLKTPKVNVDWSFKLPLLLNSNAKKIKPLYCVLNYLESSDFTFSLSTRMYGKTNWKKVGSYAQKGEGKIKIPLSQNYCNGFWLKAEGSGMFCPESITVYYRSAG